MCWWIGARVHNRQLGVLQPLWLLTLQEAARESTDSGQPIRAQGVWSTLRLTSSLSVTLLTSAGPRDGKYEEPGATLTSRQPPPEPLFSLLRPPTPTSGLKPCCVTRKSTNTCCLSPEAHHMAFYCRADAKKHHTEKQWVRRHTFTCSYNHIPCTELELCHLHFL